MDNKDKVILPLFRPQYVSASEGFINAIAWSLFEPRLTDTGKKIGLRFRGQIIPTGQLKIVYTEPAGDALDHFERELASRGLVTNTEDKIASVAAINSVLGVKTDSGKFHPASPLSLNLALMQNTEGLFGSENPAPLADILEGIFSLGSTSPTDETVAGLWLHAVEHRLSLDPVLKVIDESFGATVFDGSLVRRSPASRLDSEHWKDLLEDTPFSWFARVWRKITSQEWVEALPARVWTDWATAILRMAYGLSYLWECAWYESLAVTLIANEPDKNPSAIKARMDSVLAWRKKSSGADIRDLSSKIKNRAQRAYEIRSLLETWLKNNCPDEMSFESIRVCMAADSDLVSSLRSAQKPKRGNSVGKGLREAIRYALITRGDKSLSSTDYYGLLRMSGTRYLFPEPGIEWIAVMTSMSCKGPGATTYLSNVARDLAEAGLRPDTQELIELLEKAGLARGSADADQGVVVEAAY
jgi:hypothetical protein